MREGTGVAAQIAAESAIAFSTLGQLLRIVLALCIIFPISFASNKPRRSCFCSNYKLNLLLCAFTFCFKGLSQRLVMLVTRPCKSIGQRCSHGRLRIPCE